MFKFNEYEATYWDTLVNLLQNAQNLEEKIQILSLQKDFIIKMQEFEIKWLNHQLEQKKQDDTYSLQRSQKRD